MMRRREALVAAGAGLAALVGGLPRAHAAGGQLRIGYQKYGTLVAAEGARHAGEAAEPPRATT